MSTIQAVWTIKVDGVQRKLKTMNFGRQLINQAPSSFSATVEYAQGSPIEFFDLVQIYRNGVLEWKGFVERIEIIWDEDGRFYNIGGRDITVILWKKYSENFTDMHEDTKGFFGRVSANELIKFLLRTPKSDLGDAYPNNKSGWGLDVSRINEAYANRTSYGDPEWAFLRRRGLGWRNSGNPYESTDLGVILAGTIESGWEKYGSPQYLEDEDDDDYIKGVLVNAKAEFKFADAPSNATNLQKVYITTVWKPDQTYWWWIQAECQIAISKDGGNSWSYIGSFGGRENPLNPNPWRHYTFDISYLFSSIDELKQGKVWVRYENKSSALATFITQAYLSINYESGGNQQVGDEFGISFAKETIVGIYVESRSGDDDYPRNYQIITMTDQKEKFTDGWTEYDPNGHIALEDNNETIKHEHFTNETAYFYKDYGTNNINEFERKFGFRINARQWDWYNFIPFCVSTHLDDFKDMRELSGRRYIAVTIVSHLVGRSGSSTQWEMRMRYSVRDATGIHETTGTKAIGVGAAYYVRVVRAGGTVYFKLYTNSEMGGDSLVEEVSISIDSNQKFQYRMHANTYDYSSSGEDNWSTQIWDDGYGFENTLVNWSRHGGSADIYYDSGTKYFGDYAMKLVMDGNEGYYFESDFDNISNSDRMKLYFYLKFNEMPVLDNINTNLPVDDWQFVHNDFTHVNTDPWLHDDDGDGNYISIWNAQSLGDYDEYWHFSNLDAKYEVLNVTNAYVRLKGRLYDGAGGHCTSMTFECYVWDGTQWVSLGMSAIDSTSYMYLQFNCTSVLNTLEKINNARLKIVYSGVMGGGSDKGGANITYAYLHVEGKATYGRIILAQLFNRGKAGTGRPYNDKILTRLEARRHLIDGVVSAWRLWLVGYDEGGYWQHDTGYTISGTSWYQIGVGYKSSDGSGWAKLWVDGSLVTTKTGINTGISTRGLPDTFDVMGDYWVNGSPPYGPSRTIWLDYPWIQIGWTRTLGRIYSNEYQEIVLANITNNTYRDIIHSWAPLEVNNLKIKITQSANYAWAISQIYIYKAESVDYRAWKEVGTPIYPDAQYIRAVSIDDTYGPAIGPLNIPRGRLIDVVNSLVGQLHETYVPYEWWMVYNDYNTFHLAERRGSDKSGIIKFELGENLGGTSHTKESYESATRLQIVGRGEDKRQEDVSSDWKTKVGSSVNTFYEEIISEKTIANKEIANTLADITLEDKSEPEEQLVADITRDEYASMQYDVGDDVTLTDALINFNGSRRIYNIEKTIDEQGEHITLFLSSPFEDVEDTWGEIYRRLKDLEIVGTLTSDWSDEGFEAEKVDADKLAGLFEKSAQNDEVPLADDDEPDWDTIGGGDGCEWQSGNEKFGIWGPNSGGTERTLQVILAKDIIKNRSGEDVTNYVYYMSDNPKMVFEIKCYEHEGVGPTYWREGDYVDFGFKNNSTGYGYWFRVVKVTGGIFDVYAYWREIGDSTDQFKKIRSIGKNTKYRFEIITDKERRWVIFNTFNISANAKNAISCVKTGLDIQTEIRPFYGRVTANHGNITEQRAIVYLYRVKIEVERLIE